MQNDSYATNAHARENARTHENMYINLEIVKLSLQKLENMHFIRRKFAYMKKK